ncbi:MAG TPA: SAM-dependent methyltransferase [Pseudonocardiaceae bacterium]|jgi:hypothetical protein
MAGIRDCWLDGSHHTAADQDVAERILVGAPHLPYSVRTYRMLLGRVVRHLVGAGVRQFLDLGSGLPTAGNVHEVAQDIDPECRVVYVDVDPYIVTEGRDLLAGADNATIVVADLRHPAETLDAARRTAVIDWAAPVAVLMIDILHHVHDVDNPTDIVRGYLDAVCPGSHLVVAHASDDEALVVGLALFHRFYHLPIPALTFRTPDQIAEFFKGLDSVEPGIVPVPLWRAESGDDLGTYPEKFPGFCGLASKP